LFLYIKILYYICIMKFKDKDIIVRCYKSGRTAVGIYNNKNKNNLPSLRRFRHLGKTFELDGGLDKYDIYGTGIIDDVPRYVYRYPTNDEITQTLKLLDDDINLGSEFVKEYRDIVRISMRKNKLKKLNNEKIK